jgi:hypothetical protein
LFSLTFDESANELTFLGGGGIDVTLADNWALRAGADIQRVSSDGESGDLFRIQAGVIYRTGTSSSFRSTPPVSVQPVSPSFGGQGGAPLNEVSVEYAFLRELEEGGGNVPFGWNASYARNLSRSLGLVGEIGTASKPKVTSRRPYGTSWEACGSRAAARRRRTWRPWAA